MIRKACPIPMISEKPYDTYSIGWRPTARKRLLSPKAALSPGDTGSLCSSLGVWAGSDMRSPWIWEIVHMIGIWRQVNFWNQSSCVWLSCSCCLWRLHLINQGRPLQLVLNHRNQVKQETDTSQNLPPHSLLQWGHCVGFRVEWNQLIWENYVSVDLVKDLRADNFIAWKPWGLTLAVQSF